jgi:hypothetical protein
MQNKISLPVLLPVLLGLTFACANDSKSGAEVGYAPQQETAATPPQTESLDQSATEDEVYRSSSNQDDGTDMTANGWTSSLAAASPSDKKASPTVHNSFISSTAAVVSADTSKQFIRTADMRFRVADARTATLRAEAITQYFGGWVTQSNLVSTTNRVEVTPVSPDSALERTFYTVTSDLTLRIPQKQLDTTIKSIARLIEYLDYRSIGAEDIALKNLAESLKQKRNQEHDRRLREAVDTRDSKLSGVADVEAARLHAQINADQALLNKLTLKDKVEYSLVTVHLYQREAVLAEMIANHKNIDAYRPGFFSRLGTSLAAGWASFLDFLIELLRAWPVLLLIGTAALVVYRKFFRKKA